MAEVREDRRQLGVAKKPREKTCEQTRADAGVPGEGAPVVLMTRFPGAGRVFLAEVKHHRVSITLHLRARETAD